MILVDRDIKKLGSSVIIRGYREENVGPVSYDLTIGAVLVSDQEVESYALAPGEMVFIRTAEQIHMPRDLMGRIGEKNSRMRQGLWVAGPHYFPGHQTYMFLRVVNLSPGEITLKKGQQIAQIFFEQLTREPEKAYDQREDASFNQEEQYRGLGKYTGEYYGKQIREVADQEKKRLEQTTSKLYENVLTLMGLFVSIFSLIMVNFSNVSSGNVLSREMILTINLSLGFVIALFMGLLLLFINRKPGSKALAAAYIGVLGALLLVITCVL